MKLTDTPKKQPTPFAVNGRREELLPTTPAGDNTASYNSGFPPVTMILKSAGGLPPKGQDMNQILFELSSICRWFSAGGAIKFDADFCNAINGYPLGAYIMADDNYTMFRCAQDNNKNDPNINRTGWVRVAADIATTLGLKAAAYLDVGVTSGTVAAGNDSRFSQMIGVDQSWQNLTASRNLGVTYTNTTGKPIQVLIDFVRPTTNTAWSLYVTIDGVEGSAGSYCPIIPNGSTYSVSGTNITINRWRELR